MSPDTEETLGLLKKKWARAKSRLETDQGRLDIADEVDMHLSDLEVALKKPSEDRQFVDLFVKTTLALLRRLTAKDKLLVAYRIQGQPTERTFKTLEDTIDAEEDAKAVLAAVDDARSRE